MEADQSVARATAPKTWQNNNKMRMHSVIDGGNPTVNQNTETEQSIQYRKLCKVFHRKTDRNILTLPVRSVRIRSSSGHDGVAA